MELACEPGILLVAYALVAAVVHIHEEFTPVAAQCLGIYGITMVLTGDIAAVGAHLPHWLVVRAMSIFQFIYGGSTCLGKQLVAHTYTANRLAAERHLTSYHVHCILAHVGVARTIAEEESVEVH